MEHFVVPFISVDAAGAVADLLRCGPSDIVAVAIDVGQSVPLDELRDAALTAGAVRCHVFERRERLAAHFLWPALKAGAVGVAGEPVVTALSAPCVAEVLVEVARLEHATAMVAVASGRRQRQRLLAALRALAPDLGIVAGGRDGVIEEAPGATARVEVPAAGHGSATPLAPHRAAAQLTVTIEHGLPVSLNHVAMAPMEMLDSLTTIAGARPGGYSASAIVLHRACAAVAARALDDATQTFLLESAAAYARLVRDGHWFSRLRAGLDALSTQVLDGVSGEVTMTIQPGGSRWQA